MKLPVSFKEFIKKPVLAITYMLLFAVAWLYIDGKRTSINEEKKWNDRLTKCEQDRVRDRFDLDVLRVSKERSDSLLNRISATMETLQKLGKINLE